MHQFIHHLLKNNMVFFLNSNFSILLTSLVYLFIVNWFQLSSSIHVLTVIYISADGLM
jgi:hypothetical protein